MVRGHAFALLIGALLATAAHAQEAAGVQEEEEVAVPDPVIDEQQQQPSQQDQLGEWVEHFDKASGKPFFYNDLLKQTAWEAPAGARVRLMGVGGGSGGAGSASAATGGHASLVVLAVVLPIALPILGLLICYYQASKEGLSDVLKALRQKRDRSAKRRGQKAGGNFRQRQKLSQDGKGGRSANS